VPVSIRQEASIPRTSIESPIVASKDISSYESLTLRLFPRGQK
jgi:hypothetical protein